jgi:hypothetical protein
MKRLLPTILLVLFLLPCIRTNRRVIIMESREIDPEWRFDRKEWKR